MNKRERDIRDMVRAAELEIFNLAHARGGHFKAVLRNAAGATDLQIFPVSGSDYRGHLNKMAELRRFARAGADAKRNARPSLHRNTKGNP